MHPAAKTAIKRFLQDAKANSDKANVPHEDYLVCSLFCLFERTTITNSFQMKNKDGNNISDEYVALM